MNKEKINTIEIGTVTCVGFLVENYPMEHGNCFTLIDEYAKEYRIVNFAYENLDWALKNKKITFPIRIQPLSEKVALIDDIRIPSNWYGETYCEGCCPQELLTEPQKMEIERQKEREERIETKIEGGLTAIKKYFSKHPKW